MCLIAIALHCHPRYELVLIANRDEFFARPTAPAAFWSEAPEILAGRDLEKGGTWLGVTRTGRLAAITNFRGSSRGRPQAPSRGGVVARYLRESSRPREFLNALLPEAPAYNDFNLLVGEVTARGISLDYFSTVENSSRSVVPGIHGLSNHLLDTPWPKVERARAGLAELLARFPSTLPTRGLFELLREDAIAPDELLPVTGVGLEHERRLSPIFIQGGGYGTRSSTVVAFRIVPGHKTNCIFIERTFDGSRSPDSFQEVEFEFDLPETPG